MTTSVAGVSDSSLVLGFETGQAAQVIGCLDRVIDSRFPGTVVFGPRAFYEVSIGNISVYCDPRGDRAQSLVAELNDSAFATLLELEQQEEAKDRIGTDEMVEMARALGRFATGWKQRFDDLSSPSAWIGNNLQEGVPLKSRYIDLGTSFSIQGGFIQQWPFLDSGAHDLNRYWGSLQYRNIVRVECLTEDKEGYIVHLESSYVLINGEDLLVGFEVAVQDERSGIATYMGNDGMFRVVPSGMVLKDRKDNIVFSALHVCDDTEEVEIITDSLRYVGLTDLMNKLYINLTNPN